MSMYALYAWARYDYADSAHMGREASPLCNDKPQGGNMDEKHDSKIKKTSCVGSTHKFAGSTHKFAGSRM
jgi:hypothetical protein